MAFGHLRVGRLFMSWDFYLATGDQYVSATGKPWFSSSADSPEWPSGFGAGAFATVPAPSPPCRRRTGCRT
jgi:hypothetical protein